MKRSYHKKNCDINKWVIPSDDNKECGGRLISHVLIYV